MLDIALNFLGHSTPTACAFMDECVRLGLSHAVMLDATPDDINCLNPRVIICAADGVGNEAEHCTLSTHAPVLSAYMQSELKAIGLTRPIVFREVKNSFMKNYRPPGLMLRWLCLYNVQREMLLAVARAANKFLESAK